MARILRLPNHGRLIVCTDLQGCLRDYERIVSVFLATLDRWEGDAHILFTGDMVHGPHLDVDEWPDFLGEYYRDESGEVMDRLVALSERYPGRVHALVGNHEHGHIGGPHTAKFAVDEVVVLEGILGRERTRRLKQLLLTLPLVAVAPCGAVFTHGAPAARIKSPADIEATRLDAGDLASPLDILDTPVLGAILWARSASRTRARAFLRAMGGTISIYGHDVIPEGFERVGDEQIIVSTSFGVYDEFKVYLHLDLAAHYATVHSLSIGREILPLFPSKASRRLGGLAVP